MIRRVDENWAEGMLADKIGIFPISYVEVSRCVEASRVSILLSRPVLSVQGEHPEVLMTMSQCTHTLPPCRTP